MEIVQEFFPVFRRFVVDWSFTVGGILCNVFGVANQSVWRAVINFGLPIRHFDSLKMCTYYGLMRPKSI